jgi:hypothetical protein
MRVMQLHEDGHLAHHRCDFINRERRQVNHLRSAVIRCRQMLAKINVPRRTGPNVLQDLEIVKNRTDPDSAVRWAEKHPETMIYTQPSPFGPQEIVQPRREG